MSSADASSDAVPVDADFIGDVRRQMLALLRSSGFDASEHMDASRACRLYFNARKRRIEPRVRKVHFSRELQGRAAGLADCHGIEAVRCTSEAGGNLNPFLSTRIEDLECDDLLLNDWGIHHLHLGTWRRKRRKGFVGRSSSLLCARLEPNAAYFIDIIAHKPSSSFADDSLMAILHGNWPDLLERYRLNGVQPVSEPFTPKQRERLRHAGVSVGVQVDGAVYAPPGGGYMTSKFSMESVLLSDRLLWAARSLEAQCRANPSALLATVQRTTGRVLARLAIALLLDADGLRVVETQTGAELWSGIP